MKIKEYNDNIKVNKKQKGGLLDKNEILYMLLPML